MQNVAIWGFGESGKKLYQIIKSKTKDNVVCFIDNNLLKLGDKLGDSSVVSIHKLKKYYDEKIVDSILIPALYVEPHIEAMIQQLEDIKINENDIYTVPSNIFLKSNLNDNDIKTIYTNYHNLIQLFSLEFHVANHCNLKCKRCNHFSNLIEEESFVEFEDFKREINKIGELIPNICQVKLLGGEPLLNNNLDLYIDEARKVYPYSELMIITNAILLKSMNKKLIDTIKRNNAVVSVTIYPPMENKVDELITFLKDNNINFNVFRCGDYFYPILNIKGNSNVEKVTKCCPRCNVIHEGKIKRCTFGMFIKYFNKYYNTSFPEGGGIDLFEDGLSGIDLIKRLKQPIDFCRFCGMGENYKWEQSGDKVDMNDYIIQDISHLL